MEKFHHDPYINSDLRHLSHILSNLLASHLKAGRPQLRILNLACGRADETGALIETLKPYSPQLSITGVDIRNRELEDASLIWKSSTDTEINFISQNAVNLFDVGSFRSSFDIAFMRHQNFWNGDFTWHKIYDNALHALEPSGILIITSYFDREHLLALKAIQSLGARLVTSFRNPNSRTIDTATRKSIDRHIAFFTLPSTST